MSSSGDRFTDIDLEIERLPVCFDYITWKVLSLEEAMKDLHGVLPEINRFVKLAKKRYIHPDKHNLTKDEAAAIYLYTMQMPDDVCVYRILNQTLRMGDQSKALPWFGYLKLLDSAVSKLPKFKGTVWRGLDKDITKLYQNGQRIIWSSVTSCSTSVNVVSSFLKKGPESTLFNIDCANGKLIAAYTRYPKEDEVILMPNATFEVVGDPLNHHGGLNVIQLKQIIEGDDGIEKQGTSASASTSVAQNFSTINIEYEEFARPGTCKKLACKGRPCAKCHQCRDWHFTGDRDIWDWIANLQNWKDDDWERYRRDDVWKSFTKRDDATCTSDAGAPRIGSTGRSRIAIGIALAILIAFGVIILTAINAIGDIAGIIAITAIFIAAIIAAIVGRIGIGILHLCVCQLH